MTNVTNSVPPQRNGVLVIVPNSTQAENVPRDLVYGCWCAGKRIGGISFPPLTSVLIATILRDAGIPADFRDLAGEGNPMEVLDPVINAYGLLVMLTSTMTIDEDADVLEHYKRINPHLLTVVWGSHPTFLPKQTLSRSGIDVAVRGEGDWIIRDLALNYFSGKDWRSVPGIAFRSDGGITVNPSYPLISDLDDLPFPDRSMLSGSAGYFNPVVKRTPYTTVYATRGCPGKCTFCTVPAFYGGKIRLRSAGNIIDELKLIAKQGYKEVFFRDETFTANKQRVLEVATAIRENDLDLTWICSSRIGSIDEEMIRVMAQSGCHMIRVGVESGSQRILDNVKKGINLGQTEQLMDLAHRHGVDVHAHMMLGMPGETRETVEETIRFIKRIRPSIVTFGICTPYPGTKLFEEVALLHPDIEDGSACNLSKLHQEGFFNSAFCSLEEKELGRLVRRAYRSFYMQPRYLASRLRSLYTLGGWRRDIRAGWKVLRFALEKEGK